MIGKVCMIILHGSGSCGQDIAGYLDNVPIPEYRFETFRDAASALSMDIITPSAASRRYTAFGGERCNVWYDRSADFMRRGLNDTEDLDGVEQSLSKVLMQIQQVEHKYDHIFIGGFSMGGGLALHTLRKNQPEKLRGIFTMGSFLVQESAVVTGPLGRSAQVPVLMMHGESDSMIRCEWGRQTAANLLLRDLNVQFRTYKNVDHEMDTSELADLLDWIKDTLLLHQEQSAATASCDSKEPCFTSASAKHAPTGDKHEGDGAHTQADAKEMAPSKEETINSAPSSLRQSKESSYDASCKQGHPNSAAGAEMEMEMEVDSTSEVALSAAQLKQDHADRQQQQRQNRAAVTSAPEPERAQKGGDLAQAAGMLIPYTVEYVRNNTNIRPDTSETSTAGTASRTVTTSSIPSVRLHYTVPHDLVGVLTARPVLACGSMFEILADPPGGVVVLLESSDPHSTAVQIGLRLQNRISGGSATLNPCPVS